MNNVIEPKFTCYHAHDYSVIELNGEDYLNICNVDDEEDKKEYDENVAKIENLVKLLNESTDE